MDQCCTHNKGAIMWWRWDQRPNGLDLVGQGDHVTQSSDITDARSEFVSSDSSKIRFWRALNVKCHRSKTKFEIFCCLFLTKDNNKDTDNNPEYFKENSKPKEAYTAHMAQSKTVCSWSETHTCQADPNTAPCLVSEHKNKINKYGSYKDKEQRTDRQMQSQLTLSYLSLAALRPGCWSRRLAVCVPWSMLDWVEPVTLMPTLGSVLQSLCLLPKHTRWENNIPAQRRAGSEG